MRVQPETVPFTGLPPSRSITRDIADTMDAMGAGQMFFVDGVKPVTAKTAAYRHARRTDMQIAVSIKHEDRAAIACIGRRGKPRGLPRFDLLPFRPGETDEVRPKWSWGEVRTALANMMPGSSFRIDRERIGAQDAVAKARKMQYLRRLIADTKKPILAGIDRDGAAVVYWPEKPSAKRKGLRKV